MQPSMTIPAGGGPLRAALAAAPPGATLRLSPGDHVGPFVVMADVTLCSRDLANPAVLRGGGEGSLLPIDGKGVTVTIHDLVLSGGGDTNAGGLIRIANGAILSLERVTLREGSANGYGGGGLFIRRGEVSLVDCTIERCSGRSGGGLLVANDATLDAKGCVFVDNTAAHGGAAVAVRDRARVTLRSCSFVGQQRPAGAGDGPGWLIDATLSSGAKAVSLEDCTLPAVRDGALRLS